MSIYNWSLACSNVNSVYMTIYTYICDLKYIAIGIFELSHNYTFYIHYEWWIYMLQSWIFKMFDKPIYDIIVFTPHFKKIKTFCNHYFFQINVSAPVCALFRDWQPSYCWRQGLCAFRLTPVYTFHLLMIQNNKITTLQWEWIQLMILIQNKIQNIFYSSTTWHSKMYYLLPI